jgi:plasmid stabilization system protein ParE
MAYRVEISSAAEFDAYTAYERIREVAPVRAEKWLAGLFAAIATLGDMPGRCPVIPEARELGHEARHLLYGRRTGTYRIIFDTRGDGAGGPTVVVLRIWHSSRHELSASDIEFD